MVGWFPDWTGERCVIVASGPSAVEKPIDLARGRARAIAINNSWRLAPWADVLYASDAAWWAVNAPDFAGLRVSRSDVPGVERVHLCGVEGAYHNDLIFDEPGVIGAGGCSGFQALNLAIQWGARDIALVGFDARVDLGVHWHGKHTATGNPTESTASMWVYHMDRQAGSLKKRGIRVVNCSPVSALQGYEKMGLERWLEAKAWRG